MTEAPINAHRMIWQLPQGIYSTPDVIPFPEVTNYLRVLKTVHVRGFKHYRITNRFPTS